MPYSYLPTTGLAAYVKAQMYEPDYANYVSRQPRIVGAAKKSHA
ncbi:MAG TPA: hypothetical protein VFD70_17975 [Anaerolineae bacterium]|nr:hypothetical protein [Anaerolineae bacterium]